jgi:hypothetical protein
MKTHNFHILFETKDKLAPREIKDVNGEVVLAMCQVCGRAESELETPCYEVKQQGDLHVKLD